MNRTRFVDLIDTENLQDEKIVFIGTGSVGSNLVRVAVASGVESVVLYDNDLVGPENIAVSWLTRPGEFKVDDIEENITRLYGASVIARPERARSGSVVGQIDNGATMVVVSTDNIESRRMVYNSFVESDCVNVLYVDFRIGAYAGYVYTFFGRDVEQRAAYEQTLNNVGTGVPCGAKAYPGLTLGWCPGTMVDILARKSLLLPQIYHRSCNANPTFVSPQYTFMEP